jgi:hypothetical protein
MDKWHLIINFLTVSLICNGPLKFVCLGFKIIQNYPYLINVHSKYGGSCSIYVHREGWLCCSRRLHDKIEQLPTYFKCTWSNF